MFPEVSSETFAFIFKEGLPILEAEGKMFFKKYGSTYPATQPP
jgi:hypothetical protein